MSDHLIVDDLTVAFDSGGYVIKPLDGLSFTANDGELVVLLGPWAAARRPCCHAWRVCSLRPRGELGLAQPSSPSCAVPPSRTPGRPSESSFRPST